MTSLETGNSVILAYELYWDGNTDTVNLLLYDGLNLRAAVERLEPGETYKFKVRARNIYGYGLFSDVVEIIPDDVPATMDAPITSLEYPLVSIAFTAPFDNGRPILAYQIEIFSKLTKTFIEMTAVCDGASPDVIANL